MGFYNRLIFLVNTKSDAKFHAELNVRLRAEPCARFNEACTIESNIRLNTKSNTEPMMKCALNWTMINRDCFKAGRSEKSLQNLLLQGWKDRKSFQNQGNGRFHRLQQILD